MILESEYPEYYKPYIDLVIKDKGSLVDILRENGKKFDEVLRNNKCLDIGDNAYAEGKWTLKELVQHITDTERVFSYRALVFARNDKTVLPGFDENNYVANSEITTKNYFDLLDEAEAVRESTLLLFESFTDNVLQRKGLISDKNMSVRAAGYIIAGHQLHHLNIIKERYL